MPDEVKHTPKQILQRITLFGNFLYATATGDWKNKLLLSVYHCPDRVREIFAKHRRYCMTLTVTGDQVKPKTIFVLVNWTGNWKFETSPGP